ncbi:hypothetical protein CASFOL_015851 [Castilleja foliolosa]|uniref:SKP1 component dimerisation domain-containing protein n=1 Tax=Castilleja foliolosa TaxID=1961234 RepID=A0ABD3DFA0_9LAMI
MSSLYNSNFSPARAASPQIRTTVALSPVSRGTTPGLDMLITLRHFHFGNNQLIEDNQLTGIIPSSLTLVLTLEIVRLDMNNLNGSLPIKIQQARLCKRAVFPSGQDHFNRTGLSHIGFMLSNQTFKPSPEFRAFYFIVDQYAYFAGAIKDSKGSSNTIVIIGAAAGGFILFLLLLVAGVYAIRQKKRAETATKKSDPFGVVMGQECKHWCSSDDKPSSTPVSGNELKAFDADFVKVDQSTLFDLILAAFYLNIKSLLDLTTHAVADMIQGKTPEEVRKLYAAELKNNRATYTFSFDQMLYDKGNTDVYLRWWEQVEEVEESV